MKRFLLSLLAILLVSAGTADARNIVLSTTNHVVLKGEISSKSVNKAIYDISTHPSNAIYMYINSPGGSIIAGNSLIDFLKNSPKKVYCIADFAASMAFTILQHCERRYVMNNSVIMQHEASIGLENSVPKFLSLLKMLLAMIYNTEKETASRIGLSYKAYKKHTSSDWWLYGKNAVSKNIADKLVAVRCTKKLTETLEKETLKSFFTTLDVEWSGCPLITYPVKVDGDKSLLQKSEELRNKDWDIDTIKEINRYTVDALQD
jgi:ATP-dependent Clp protease protease subunit